MSNEFAYSVLMSVYSGERPEPFREAIESMLNQTIAPSEFVIVCDGPLTVDLDDVIEDYKSKNPALFHIVRLSENKGLGTALAEGVHCCRCDWIARMDSDDLCLRNRIECQVAVVENDATIGLIGTNAIEFLGSPDQIIARVVLPETDADIRRFYRRRCAFRHPSLLMRKQDVLDAGNYSGKYYLFEDMDLFGRMLANGVHSYNVQHFLTQVRVGDSFFQRRGGFIYIKSMAAVRLMLLRIGVSRPIDFIVSTLGQAIVCLMPNRLREAFYRRFLRD